MDKQGKLGKRLLAVVLAAGLLVGGMGMLGVVPAAAAFTTTPMIAASGNHSLVLKSDGTVWAWGDNSYGGLGLEDEYSKWTPIQVPGLNSINAIAVGSLCSFALKSNGTVLAWGNNGYGQLGDGTTEHKATPSPVQGLNGITAIAAGTNFALALKNDGTVWAWGYNGAGQLGDGTTTYIQNTPVQVQGLDSVVTIVAGEGHSLAIKSDGTLWAWGQNGFGQLGISTSIYRSNIPVHVQGIEQITSVTAGRFHTVAIKGDGTVWAWGYNPFGQLGNGTTTNSNTPVQTQGINGIIGIAAGSFYSTAIRSDGAVFEWGRTNLGDASSDRVLPVEVQGISKVIAIDAANTYNSIALKNDGTVWTWGENGYGNLGDGSITSRSTPVQVKGENGVGFFNVYDGTPQPTTYTITYNANGGSVTPSSASVTAGTATTLPTPTRSGYTCTGWFTATSGGTKIGNAGASYTPTASVTLYAQWEADNPNVYAVNYNTNCPNPADVSNMPLPQIKSHGVALTLSDKIPTRTGYIFKGWGTTPTRIAPDYLAGGTYSADTDVTLYAVWEKMPLGSVNISFPVYNDNNRKATVSVPWDDRLFEQPATQFSQNLAKTAMALSAASYDISYINNAISDMGFTERKMYNYMDNFDAYTIAKKKILVDGQEKNLICVVLRGTGGGAEWYSDIVENISGFEAFAGQVKASLSSYISNSLEDRILITGHSRGAAAANLLGMELKRQGVNQANTYVYTFATPNTTTSNDTSGYDNIFNIVNVEDFITTVPPLLKRFGITKLFHRNSAPLMKEAFKELTGGKNLDLFMDVVEVVTTPLPSPLAKAGKIFYAHPQETYLSCLLAYDENGAQYKDVYDIKRSIIACPVDVAVYNEAGALVGKVINNQIEFMTGHVMIVLDGDIKYIYTPTLEKYRLELLATDIGQMNYIVEDVDFANQTTSRQKKFQSVVLEPGKRMTSTIGDDIATPSVRLLVVDGNGTILREVQQNGAEIATTQPKGIFGTNPKWYGEWWHYLLFFLCFGFIWMWF